MADRRRGTTSRGQRVKRMRLHYGWKQQELAERAQVKVALVSRIERNVVDCHVSQILKLVAARRCTPNELLWIHPDDVVWG